MGNSGCCGGRQPQQQQQCCPQFVVAQPAQAVQVITASAPPQPKVHYHVQVTQCTPRCGQ
jgi:hypothetical protein